MKQMKNIMNDLYKLEFSRTSLNVNIQEKKRSVKAMSTISIGIK